MTGSTLDLANPPARVPGYRIAAKHFDFVVCRTSDLVAGSVVELNDRPHVSRHANARDQFIQSLCKTINLPLLQAAARAAH